jgi:PAS domain S-box-containing protein
MVDLSHGRDDDAATDRARLAAIVDSSDDVIVSKTLDGVILTWNRAAERLFGWTSEEAVGKHITLIIPDNRRSEEDEVLARIRRGEPVDHFETVRQRKDGSLVDVSITVSPIRDGSGRIVGASKIGRDITDRRRVEQEREEFLARERRARADAERANRAKDDFLATLSHELRTPLNAILGWAHVLATARRDPDMIDRAVETITRNAKQQSRLIEDLLDVSAILGGKLRLDIRPVDLGVMLTAALENIRPAADAKRIQLGTSLAPPVGPMRGDPERLQQVFWNLLSNAVKFTPAGGRVDVTLEFSGDRAVVRVSDTGIGIRPDLLPVIFERFRQADSSISRTHGGLGLGLAIAKQLVEMHGGRVEAASPGEGRGTTMTVTLRAGAIQIPTLDPGEIVPSDLDRCDGIHVLLVDDDEDGRKLVQILLEQGGARVTTAGSALEALAAMKRETPDILISDLAMPEMDGYALIQQMRQLPALRRLPAIALTAHPRGEMRVRALQAGFDTYVAKPLDPAELLTVVVTLTRRRTGGSGQQG